MYRNKQTIIIEPGTPVGVNLYNVAFDIPINIENSFTRSERTGLIYYIAANLFTPDEKKINDGKSEGIVIWRPALPSAPFSNCVSADGIVLNALLDRTAFSISDFANPIISITENK